MSEPSVKVLITYKDRHTILESDVFIPVQTGRAVSDDIFGEMIGDDTGKNISGLNPNFCELTAIYWAWKNYDKIGNPDYIGFMHYRRHFVFNKELTKNSPEDYFITAESIDDNYKEKFHLKDEYVVQAVKACDCIMPRPYRQAPVREQYAAAHNVADYDAAMEILKACHPEWKAVAEEYNKCEYPIFFCMFIMRRQQFFDMCEWLFDILLKTYKKLDISRYDSYQARAIGFIGERLIGMYLYNLKYHTNLKIEQLDVSYVNSTPYELLPCYDNGHAICFACSNYYVPYLLVALTSMKQHFSQESQYDIIIFERDISLCNKRIITNVMKAENTSVRFCNPMKFFEGLNIFTYEHIPLETYFKITMPNILKSFKRVLFLDSDILILHDVNELLDMDLHGKTIGAHYCTLWAGIAGYWTHVYEYTKTKLGLNNVNDYFQGGVLLFNVAQYIDKGYMQRLIDASACEKFICVDQCALNLICKDDVFYFDGRWNYETLQRGYYDTVNRMPHYFKLDRAAAKSSPYIIHYSGPAKPWKFLDEEFAAIWWRYARQTPQYEEIIKRTAVEYGNKMYEKLADSNRSILCRLYVAKHRGRKKLELAVYRMAKHVTFGRACHYFDRKFTKIKHLLKMYANNGDK